jgi:para-nitrobenzyl esterase
MFISRKARLFHGAALRDLCRYPSTHSTRKPESLVEQTARPCAARLTAAAAGVAAGLMVVAGAPVAHASSAPLVQTAQGPVQGFNTKGIAEFLGVPYAQPPVGNLRWQPPQQHSPWTNVLQATSFGPTCAQITTLGVFAGPANNNEDCLYLNVFTPNVTKSGNLPVLVWIHGGGNVDGESSDYDASKLAAQGNVVVVTINYRLGLLGWLANPALDAEGHPFGNYGLLDQQFALKWVQQNIAGFGGDKTNVTLGGQSAGSIDTESNVVSPLAAGLFQRAIFESVLKEATPLAYAEALGSNFAVAAGCGSGATTAVAACLRNLPVQQIMNLEGTTSTTGPYVTSPIADGTILPASGLWAAFNSGQFSHMPIMSGTVRDEANFGLAITEYFSGPPRVPVDATDFMNYVTSTYSGNAGPGGSLPAYPPGTVDKVLKKYPLRDYPTVQLAYDAAGTATTACLQLAFNKVLSTQVPVYAYEFNDQTAPSYFPPMPGFQPLAYHTSDIQYLFPLWHGGPLGTPHPLNRQQEDLSDALVTAWTNFAWTGNPNGQGNNPWPRYIAGSLKSSYYLSENIPALSTESDKQFSTEHQCSFWQKLLVE